LSTPIAVILGKGNMEELKERAIFALSRLRGRPMGDIASDVQIKETLRYFDDLPCCSFS